MEKTTSHAKIAVRAAARVGQTWASTSSAFRVAKQRSAIALSRHSPLRLIKQTILRAARAACQVAAVYGQPRSVW